MPGDSRVQRTLDNLNELSSWPAGWSQSDDEKIASIAAEAKQVIESLDELGPDTAVEQGISRLAMLAFLSGEDGPYWNGATGASNRWVRYRGHHIDRDEGPDGLLIAVVHADHVGDTTRTFLTNRTGREDMNLVAVRLLRDIDALLDAVFAVHPLVGDAQLATSATTELGFTALLRDGTREVHHFDIENHARSFNEGYDAAMAQHLATDPTIADEWLEQHDVVVRAAAIDAALDAAKQVSDATAHLPAENASVWDVIERLQKLRPVDAPTEQDRAEAEADDERDGKAAARAEEVQTDGE